MTEPRLPEDDLRKALRELARADAPEILDRARGRALARAERLIEAALVEELLLAAAALRGGQAIDGADPVPTDGSVASPAGEPVADPVSAAASDGAPPGDGDAWWTYCIMRAQDTAAVASALEGIEPGSCVEAVGDGDLAALVSRVPLAEYEDDQLRAHLEDLEWLGRTARAHEQVLDAVLAEATIVPLRLCTIYRDREGVRRLLREQGPALREGLGQVEGCVEWGVKLFADPRAQKVQTPSDADGLERRGATYLLRRQEERALAEKANEVRARCAEVVHERVGALARVVASNPPQRPEIHGRDLTMLLNGAYLVERNRAAELETAVATLQEEWEALGFAIELTGPWPPYNFVSGAAGVLS